MAKRAIGLDITSHSIRAVQLVKKSDQLHIEKVFVAPTRRDSDVPADIIRRLTSHLGFDWRANIAVSMDHRAVFFKEFKLSTERLEQLDTEDATLLNNSFPIAPEDAVVQVCSIEELAQDEHMILVAATSKSVLEERLSTLEQVHITPQLVETDVFALRAAILVNHPSIAFGRSLIIHVDQTHLCLAVLADGKVLVVRNTPLTPMGCDETEGDPQARLAALISHEAQITWQKLYNCAPDQTNQIVLATGCHPIEELTEHLEKQIGCPVQQADPCQHVLINKKKVQCHPSMLVAEGLALRVLAPQQTTGVDFLQHRHATSRLEVNVKKEASVCGSLVLGIVIIWIIGMVTELSSLKDTYTQVKAQINQTFEQAMPQQRNVDPVAQLQQGIETLRKDKERLGLRGMASINPLTVLQYISITQPPKTDITVKEVFIGTHAITLTAACKDFGIPYQWKDKLEAIDGFAEVKINNPSMDKRTQQVNFTMDISIDEQAQP